MDISKILEEPLVVSPEDSVSKVASAMLRQRRHEALAVKDNSFRGIVLVSDIVKKNIQNPEKTKIDSFIKNVEVVFPETSILDAVNSILINNFKSLPVKSPKEKKLYIVSKVNIMKSLREESILKRITAKQIMNFPYCISRTDTVATAKAIVRDMEISSIPVINEDSRTEGLIETIDLLRVSIHSMEKASLGEEAGEKKSVKNVYASSVMQKDYAKAELDTPAYKLIDILSKAKIPTVIIEEDNKLIGMVTPRDILKLLGGQTEGVYVTISGIQKEDDFIKSVIDEEITHEVKKLAKIIPIQYLNVHVNKHEKDGKRAKYSIKTRLVTHKGAFFAHDFAWDITKAVRGVLKKLEKEMLKKEGKKNLYGRAP